MKERAEQLLAQAIQVRKTLQVQRIDQFAHPFPPFPAEKNTAAGVVALPDMALQSAHHVDLTGAGVELERKDRLAGAAVVLDQEDTPDLDCLCNHPGCEGKTS